MKNLILMAVLSLLLLSCNQNTNTVSDDKKAAAIWAKMIIQDKGVRRINRHTSLEECRADIKRFIESNIDLFKTYSSGMNVCCTLNDSRRRRKVVLKNGCINIKRVEASSSIYYTFLDNKIE